MTSGKKVLLAAPRGYCAGVDRAVVTVEKALDLYGPPVYVRKQIVHNKFVVHALEERGAIFVDEVAEIPEGSTVVFSAHGVAPVVHEQAAARNLKTIDATCPLVTKVHSEAKRFAHEGYQILLVGHEGHEEVEGTMGEAPEVMTLVEDAAGRDVDRGPGRREAGLAVADHALRRRDPGHRRGAEGALPAADQSAERRHLLRHAEPPGGREGDRRAVRRGDRRRARATRPTRSGWSRSRSTPGAKASYRVDSAAELDEAWFQDCDTVGVTSGASVPEILVDDVLAWLHDRGCGPVEEVHVAEETLIFSLPPELRRDLKAARDDVESQLRLEG